MPNILQYEQRTTPQMRSSVPFAQAPRMEGLGLGAVVEGINSMLDQYNKRQEEQARAWATDALSSARLNWTNQLIERQANAELGAPDFTGTFIRDFDEYSSQLIERAPGDIARKYVHERMADLRVMLGERAMVFESGARIDYRDTQFNKSIDNSQKLMNTDVSQYEVVLAERLAEIDSSAMPPKQRADMRQRAIDKISEAAVWSQINKSPAAFLESVGLGTHGPATRGGVVIDATTGEVIEMEVPGIGDAGKAGKPKGPLGVTGNKPFDMMSFDKRTEFIAKALTLKNQLDAESERALKNDNKELADYYMKEALARAHPVKGQKPLDRAFVEDARNYVSSSEYNTLLKLLYDDADGNGVTKSDPDVFRRLQSMLYSNPRLVYGEALKAHKNGQLSSSDLSSILGKSHELDRQGGPKTEYERSRARIVGNLDPGPFVQDPVGRGRMAEALYDFDAWAERNGSKTSDAEIAKYAEEIIKRYRFIDLSKTQAGLPQPRSGSITRGATREHQLKEVGDAWNKAKADFKNKKITKEEYDAEAGRLMDWWRTIEAEQPKQENR